MLVITYTYIETFHLVPSESMQVRKLHTLIYIEYLYITTFYTFNNTLGEFIEFQDKRS